MKGFGSHLLGMGSKVYLIEHLDADELYHRYREEQDSIKRTHLQILWLLTSGRPAKVAAEMTGYSQHWISVLVGRSRIPSFYAMAKVSVTTRDCCRISAYCSTRGRRLCSVMLGI